MLEKPNISDNTIISCVENSYGILTDSLLFLPIGNDASAFAYKITSGEDNYFLKLKVGEIYEPSVGIPKYLFDSGISQVVAPIKTKGGNLWVKVSNYSIAIYPFIDGKTGMELGMSEDQWSEFGKILKKIHATQLPADLKNQVQEENFIPHWISLIKDIAGKVQRGRYVGEFEILLTKFWKEKEFEIEKIVTRATELGKIVKDKKLPFVLCHTDIHTANILIDPNKEIHIVDWDFPLLAPKERDLSFVLNSEKIKNFTEGYGHLNIDTEVLAYYGYEWVVQEIGDYGQRIFTNKGLGDESKEFAYKSFVELFDPGNVVESAYESDNVKIR